jgi:hypothetical protein
VVAVIGEVLSQSGVDCVSFALGTSHRYGGLRTTPAQWRHGAQRWRLRDDSGSMAHWRHGGAEAEEQSGAMGVENWQMILLRHGVAKDKGGRWMAHVSVVRTVGATGQRSCGQ